MLDPKDGGYRSRKLWFAVYATGLIFAGAVVISRLPAVAPLYDTMVGGIVGITVALLTGNIAAKWVIGKANETSPVATKKQSLKEQPVEQLPEE